MYDGGFSLLECCFECRKTFFMEERMFFLQFILKDAIIKLEEFIAKRRNLHEKIIDSVTWFTANSCFMCLRERSCRQHAQRRTGFHTLRRAV
jgi:hypothetical protein